MAKSFYRGSVLLAGSATILLISTSSVAQSLDFAEDSNDQVDGGSVIVVTGTRVVRDGYNAPTPTTVVGTAEINAKAPSNLADFVNDLPALSGSTTPRTTIASISAGTGGLNALNLRNLGLNRTLVLLDGQRVGASTITGMVDINQFPQGLVQRVDVVTGGASASWGSDAVAGVVNFVLDKTYEGLKGDIQGGITTYGDDANFKVSLTAGTGFSGGRGHIILNGEIAHNEGIRGIGSRAWYNGRKIFFNPAYTSTNGLAEVLVRDETGFRTLAPGGIINSGPLSGTYFGEGGVPSQLNIGPIVSGQFMQGGQWEHTDFGKSGSLDPRTSRQNAFGRMSYELADNIEAFFQISYGRATSSADFGSLYYFSGITIKPDNAFIPGSIASSVTAPFQLGTSNHDLGYSVINSDRSSWRPVVGMRGGFDAMGTNWSWDLYAQRTSTRSYIEANLTVNPNLQAAIDAVYDSNGQIVCRSTLINPNNGCVPYNVFGTNVNGQDVRDYVNGTAWGITKLRQDVAAVNITGDPFSTWAGPVSLALGVEHRREKVSGSNDPLSDTRSYFAGNYRSTFGSYSVTEGYAEAVIPLANGQTFAQSFDLNLAVRATEYSLSGFVTTWKVGVIYQPVDDLTLRVTRSRDIRAPNHAELFQQNQSVLFTYADPFRNNIPTTFFNVTSGNLGLKPEKADTWGIGAVVQPQFFSGFAASVDYYRIDISDAVGSVNYQTSIDQCFGGKELFCSNIVRDSSGVITQVLSRPMNMASQVASGLDFEASYRTPFDNLIGGMDGNFIIRAMATHNIKNVIDNGISTPVDSVNGRTLPRWSYFGSIGWDSERWSLQATARGFSSGMLNPDYIQCSTGCPVSTADRRTVDGDIRIPAAVYFGLNTSVKLVSGADVYLSVDNVLNKDPAQIAYGTSIGGPPMPLSAALYDTLGRRFRLGLRFEL